MNVYKVEVIVKSEVLVDGNTEEEAIENAKDMKVKSFEEVCKRTVEYKAEKVA